eukprot:84145_1
MPSSSMQSLVNINRISSVNLSTLHIANNYAAQYLTFDGDSSGDFTVDNIAVIDNVNNGPFAPHALINATRYIKASILNSAFINNDNATVLLEGSLNDTLMIATCSFLHNDYLDTLVNIEGISSLTLSDLIVDNNTAVNGLLFDGQSNGDVNVTNFAFINNNIANAAIDGETLLQFNGFVSLSVDQCQLSNNDGDHLLKAILSDDITFDHCNINGNDIDEILILIDGIGSGDFTLTSSNITNNRDSKGTALHSVHSLINISSVNAVTVSSVLMSDNYAQNYLAIDGKSSGSFHFEDTKITNNMNADDSITNEILILLNDFVNGTIEYSHFDGNKHGVDLFTSSLSNELNISHSSFISNAINQSVLHMNGIVSVSIDAVIVHNNTALNPISFKGTGGGAATMQNVQFTDNNIADLQLDGETLIEFDGFSDFTMHNCDAARNDGDYLLTVSVSGDIEFAHCNFIANDIDHIMINLTSSVVGDLLLKDVNITDNANSVNATHTESTQSILHVLDIKNVLVFNVHVLDNNAANYFTFIGSGSMNGNVTLHHSKMMNNINTGPLDHRVLIDAPNFMNAKISSSQFVNNDQSIGLFHSTLNGDFEIEDSSFIGNDGPHGTMVDVHGVDSIVLNNVIMNNNTATNILNIFGNDYDGHVRANNFVFQNNNHDRAMVHGKVLILFDSFFNLNVTNCHIHKNSGDYLFKSVVFGDIQFTDCDWQQNDINMSMIDIKANHGNLMIQSTNMTHNYDGVNNRTQSAHALVDITGISYVSLLDIRITNNFANQLLGFNGRGSGDIWFQNIQITENTNNEIENNMIMINAHNFSNLTIEHSTFIDNDNGAGLFSALVDGDITLHNADWTHNDGFEFLMNVNGIHSLSMTDIKVVNNTAINVMLFYGIMDNTNNANINNFVFAHNNIANTSMNANTLLQFDRFYDLNVHNLTSYRNTGRYLLKGVLSGDIVFSNCIIEKNNIDYGLIHIAGSGDGDFIFTSSRITRNRELKGAN